MSDLISRSALYNKLVELETLARNRVLDTPINNPCYQRYVSQMNERTMLKELVADLSTAYNVDKVVAELEERTAFLKNCTKYGNENTEQQEKSYSTMMMYEIADLIDDLIDIVRKGGAE